MNHLHYATLLRSWACKVCSGSGEGFPECGETPFATTKCDFCGGTGWSSTDVAGVLALAAAMVEKMAKKVAQGRYGWDDPETVSDADLSQMMREHVSKGDPVDVANFAMMLFNRGGQITKPSQREMERLAARMMKAHIYDCLTFDDYIEDPEDYIAVSLGVPLIDGKYSTSLWLQPDETEEAKIALLARALKEVL